MEYKIRWGMDNEWAVIMVEEGGYMEEDFETVEYKGSLSDCDAFIRLKEKGYID